MTIKYPYLPEGREIKYVPEDNVFMQAARRACEEIATDINRPTGAVLVKDGKIISRVGNRAPITNRKLIELHGRGYCIRRMLKVKTGSKYWLCPGCCAPKYHSEWSAVREAGKLIDARGADVYLWGHWWCCKPCWDAMIKGGIRDVYLLDTSAEKFNYK